MPSEVFNESPSSWPQSHLGRAQQQKMMFVGGSIGLFGLFISARITNHFVKPLASVIPATRRLAGLISRVERSNEFSHCRDRCPPVFSAGEEEFF